MAMLSRTHAEKLLEEVRERLEDKDNEIAFLREQLAAAQTEVGERAASTDSAIKTLDRVVRGFEMQAEANNALARLGSTKPKTEQSGHVVRFASEAVDTPSPQQDIRRL